MEVDLTLSPPADRTKHQVLDETRTAVEEIAAKMLFIKKEGKPRSELRELITQASLHFIKLRQVNRAILLEEDRVKSEMESAKAPVDFTTLQLHNLMYEKNHYLKAIKACKDFRTKYPDIDLVPEEEFLANAPEDIKGNALSSDGAHDMMLKRLNYELFQRKELCKLHEKLEQHKKGLVDNIVARKKFLSSLPSHLKSLKKASLPVQQQLGMLHTKKLKQQRAAELLPPPLYVVYSQLLAQKEAFSEKIEMEILGSTKDAQACALQQSNKDHAMCASMDTSKEDDTPDDEDDGQRRRKRPKKIAAKDSLDNMGMYQSHPLSVILHVYDDEECDANPSKLLTLRFEYLIKMNVVCVRIEGEDERPRNSILCNLFPDDTGRQLPHQMAKLYAGDNMVFDESRSLRPYKWAQHLAGMDFLPELSPLLTNVDSSSNDIPISASILSGLSLYRHQNRAQTLLQRIRSRKKAQVALQVQVDSLTNLRWPSLAYENVPWALHSPVCVLQCWSLAGLTADSDISLTNVASEQIIDSIETNGRSGTLRDEVESTREDGELPSAVQVQVLTTTDLKLITSKGSIDVEHSRSLALIAKSVTLGKGKSLNSGKHEDDTELVLDSESDSEQQYLEAAKEDMGITCSELGDNLWEDCAVREYDLILSRVNKQRTLKLQARIKIHMEYPLRPPYFSLSLLDEISKTESGALQKNGIQWYNELRAMESEINLHILKIVPLKYENDTLAHQVCCLAMLFDFHFDQLHTCSETMKSTSIIDVGLCKPVTGKMVARSFRGRDRRKMFSWKEECAQGYP